MDEDEELEEEIRRLELDIKTLEEEDDSTYVGDSDNSFLGNARELKECTEDISHQLKESNFDFVLTLVTLIGVIKSRGIASEAQNIFHGQGILTNDGKRTKSLGGVFFHLAKQLIGVKQFSRLQTLDTKRRKNLGYPRRGKMNKCK